MSTCTKGAGFFGKKCNFHTPEWHESQRIIIVMRQLDMKGGIREFVGFHNQVQGLIFISQAIHSIHTCCTVPKSAAKHHRIIIVMRECDVKRRYKGVCGFSQQFWGLKLCSYGIYSIQTPCTVPKSAAKL